MDKSNQYQIHLSKDYSTDSTPNLQVEMRRRQGVEFDVTKMFYIVS